MALRSGVGIRGDLAAIAAQVPVNKGRSRWSIAPFVAAAHAPASRCTSGPSIEPAEMHRLLDLGVDGIMTDRPLVLRQVLGSRGLW